MGLGETLVGAGKELGLGGFEQAAANFAELGGQLVLGVLERGDLLFKGASARLNVGLKRSEVAQRPMGLASTLRGGANFYLASVRTYH